MGYTKQNWENNQAGGTPLEESRLDHMELGIEGALAIADINDPATIGGAALRQAIASTAPVGASLGGPVRLWAPQQALPTVGIQNGDIVPLLGTGYFNVRVNGAWKVMNGTAYTPPGTPSTTTLALTASTPVLVTVPGGAAGSTNEGQVTVTWATTVGTDGLNPAKVRVVRPGVDTAGGGALTQDISSLNNSLTLTKLVPGSTYVITAQFLSAGGSLVGTQQTKTVVVPSAPPGTVATKITLTATAGDAQVSVTNKVVQGTDGLVVDGVVIGRNGTDNTGGGPWSTVDPPNTTRVFDKLINGTEYTFTGDMTVATVAQNKPVAVKSTPVGGGVVTPPPGGGGTPASSKFAALSLPSRGWFSGVEGDGDVVAGGQVGTNRGSTLDAIGTWVDGADGSVWGVKPLVIDTFTGFFDIAPGGFTNWAAAASGQFDAGLVDFFQRYRAWRTIGGVIRPTVFRFGHEFNGNWYAWSVFPGGEANFRAGMTRIKNIMNTHFPEAFFAICYNGDPVSGVTAQDTFVDGVFDIIGIDQYNAWPTIKSSGPTWADAAMLGTDNNPRGAERWRLFAQRHGVPIYYPEYGHNAADGDDGYWVTQNFNWIKQHAGRGPGNIVADIWFSFNGWSLTNAPMPNVIAAYNNAFP